MARIRSIKPEFWSDGNMVGLPFEARLFFMGCWTFALCDRGHLPDDAVGLKLRIFPGDDLDGGVLLDLLLTSGRIVRLTLPDGRSFLHIPRFSDHQKVDPRWSPRCPACQSLAPPQTDSPKLTETLRDSAQDSKGKDSKGKNMVTAAADATAVDREFEDDFWTLYPRKVKKADAVKAFKRARKTTELDVILDGLRRYTKTIDGKDITFVAHASTWLNGHRWEDEPDTHPATTEDQLPAMWKGIHR